MPNLPDGLLEWWDDHGITGQTDEARVGAPRLVMRWGRFLPLASVTPTEWASVGRAKRDARRLKGKARRGPTGRHKIKLRWRRRRIP